LSHFDAIILGVLQGLTEFLPISSSGHLVVAQKLVGVQAHDLEFDVAAHLGTFLSIITVYFYLIRKLLRSGLPNLFNLKSSEGHVIRMVLVACIPTAVIGFAFRHEFESLFSNFWAVGIGFVFTGLVLFSTKGRPTQFSGEALHSLNGVDQLNWWRAIVIGTAQAIAIAPAVSRSGMTIVSGLWVGLPGQTAAMFSFILSLPAVAGAAALQLREISFNGDRLGTLALGCGMAYLAGLAGLWGVLASVRKGRLEIFSLYLVALGIYILVAWT